VPSTPLLGRKPPGYGWFIAEATAACAASTNRPAPATNRPGGEWVMLTLCGDGIVDNYYAKV
jgi:hypothetical protein